MAYFSMANLFNYIEYIKSPLNYTGGKFKILNQILPLFPDKINTFVDLFAGGCNVGININANQIICNDIINYLINLYEFLRSNEKSFSINLINDKINEFGLNAYNENAYKNFRSYYNSTKNALDLYILVVHAFNYQIRFNNNHQFNTPFGKTNSTYNAQMKENLNKFIDRIKSIDIKFQCSDFVNFDFSSLTNDDLVYCDPPYLITTGSYNDGKRGLKGGLIMMKYNY